MNNDRTRWTLVSNITDRLDLRWGHPLIAYRYEEHKDREENRHNTRDSNL